MKNPLLSLIGTLTILTWLANPVSAQWNNIAPNNSGQSIKFVSPTTGYLQSIYTMQKSTNSGASWTTIDSVSGSFNCTGMFWLNANEGFAVFSENLGFGNYAGWFKKTANGGASWTTIQQVSATQELNAVWFTSSTTGYVVGGGGLIRKTINGGSTWTTLTSGTTADLYALEFVNSTTGYVCGDNGNILKTTNSGTNWTLQMQSIFFEFLDVDFTDPLRGYVTGTYGAYFTPDGGINWNPMIVPAATQFTCIQFTSADTGYMAGPGGNVFRTTNYGATWIGLNRVNPGYFVRDLDFIDNNTGFIAVDFTGIWKTTNAGSGCPALTVQNTSSSPDTIHTCAYSNAVFTAQASAQNYYVFNITPSWAFNSALSYNQYYYVNDTIAGDTLTMTITMTDTLTGCAMITDSVVVITDQITYQPPPQSTQLIYLCPGDSVTLDLGANAQDGYLWMTTGDTTQTLIVDTIGLYSGTAYACGGQSNWIYVVQWNNNCTQVCDVDAGPDTTFCQQQGQLNATPASPGNYTFSWSPAYGLDNPNVQNPNVVIGVNNQQYIVTMTDAANNCTATDTIVVNAYYFHANDTFNVCQSTAILDFGPGASNYYWQYFTDTLGNTISLNATTQTFNASTPGTYMGFAMFPGCGALTSIFVVEDTCTYACSASISQQTIYSSACGDTVRFTGTFSSQVGQWYWLVNNQYYGYGTGGVPQLDTYIGTATYTVTLIVSDPNNTCTATTSIVVSGNTGIVPTINLLQICGAAWNSQQFNPTIVPASNNYTYSWTPATGLSDPTIRNPFVNGVYSESYTLTVTDTVTGCVGIDTINGVTVFNYVNQTIYSCNNQPVTLTTYPATTNAFNYNWSTGQTTPSISVTQPGVYTVAVQTSACSFTNVYTVIDSCTAPEPNVWPGDCNYDLTANMADALHIGLAYGATGATRPAATNGWYAQPMSDWSQNYVNCNYKHGDTNGDGVIDVNDTLAISLNYGLNHPYQFEVLNPAPATAPTLELNCTADTVGLQTLVQINVLLGNSTIPVDSLYGISFRITSESGLIDTNLTAINANTSWLGNQGNDMFTFQKHFQSSAIVDFAEVRNDLINVNNGSGNIATLFIVTTDNLSGIAVCDFTLSDVTAVTVSQEYLQLNLVNDSVVIDPSVPAGLIETEPTAQLNVYPNPANDKVVVETAPQSQIQICDVTGRVVITANANTATTIINTASLATGTYVIRAINGNSVTTQRLVIAR